MIFSVCVFDVCLTNVKPIVLRIYVLSVIWDPRNLFVELGVPHQPVAPNVVHEHISKVGSTLEHNGHKAFFEFMSGLIPSSTPAPPSTIHCSSLLGCLPAVLHQHQIAEPLVVDLHHLLP